MSQQDVTVTNVRVYAQCGVDRDLTLGTEHVSRLKRVQFTVEGVPAGPFPCVKGDYVVRLATAVWDNTRRPSVTLTARKVLKDGSLGLASTERHFFRGEIPDWLAPVIEEHTPEWAR